MAGHYDIFRVTKEKKGNPPLQTTTIERSVSDELPEGAIPLSSLRAAEEQRAENARFLRATSGAFKIFMRENDTVAQTEVRELVRGLESGTVVYELSQTADQPNGDAYAKFTRG